LQESSVEVAVDDEEEEDSKRAFDDKDRADVFDPSCEIDGGSINNKRL
jgi:hypothetical protein